MSGWWDLGEWSGFDGNELAVWRLVCPFCEEKGNFALAHRAAKKKPNESKVLNFDTYECGSCRGYVMVLWSGGDRLHDFKVLPWPLKHTKYPEHWPEAVGRLWLQAKRSVTLENWDAATLMARSAMQSAMRGKGATGPNLKQEIASLAALGVLPPLMREWADELRELGNDSAHPTPEQAGTNPRDAKDVIRYLDFLLEYLYDLPKQIEDYRSRKPN